MVGSHESVNPRSFRVLVSDDPIPTELPLGMHTIRQSGLSVFTVLIGENRRVRVIIYIMYCTYRMLMSNQMNHRKKVKSSLYLTHHRVLLTLQQTTVIQLIASKRINVIILVTKVELFL